MEKNYGTIHKLLERVSHTMVKGGVTITKVLQNQPYIYKMNI